MESEDERKMSEAFSEGEKKVQREAGVNNVFGGRFTPQG